MDNLQFLRSEIDEIDDEIVRLFNKRMIIVKKINEEKKKTGVNVSDPAREQIILDRVKSLSNSEFSDYVLSLYEEIFKLSKDYQQKSK
ncbi:MAG: chorismate mutase [Clostridia bacterium]|nr:chorismate mutase [Clostridia bacterium]